MNKLAVIRIRGDVDVKEDVKDTLHMLNLTRPNYCTIVEDNSSYKGMLERASKKVTWGPIRPGVLEKLLRERGEFADGSPVTDERISRGSPYDNVSEVAEAVCRGDYDLRDVENLEEVFRLHPPKKGYNNVSRSVGHGGALGARGEKINDLILRML